MLHADAPLQKPSESPTIRLFLCDAKTEIAKRRNQNRLSMESLRIRVVGSARLLMPTKKNQGSACGSERKRKNVTVMSGRSSVF